MTDHGPHTGTSSVQYTGASTLTTFGMRNYGYNYGDYIGDDETWFRVNSATKQVEKVPDSMNQEWTGDVTKLRYAARTIPYLADSQVIDSSFGGNVQWHTYSPRFASTLTNPVIQTRHSGRANCWFTDGHTESLTSGALLNLLPAFSDRIISRSLVLAPSGP